MTGTQVEHVLSPAQALLLFHLTFTGETPLQSKTKLDSGPRGQLAAWGFLDKKKAPAGRGQVVAVTELGRGWVERHLDHELPKQAQMAGMVQGVLSKLGAYLRKNGLSLAVLWGEEAPPPPPPPPPGADSVRKAYLAESGGRTHTRVRLAALKKHFPHTSKTEFDECMLHLHETGKLVLFGLDDPLSIHAEDRVAAIDLGGGFYRHIVYLEN